LLLLFLLYYISLGFGWVHVLPELSRPRYSPSHDRTSCTSGPIQARQPYDTPSTDHPPIESHSHSTQPCCQILAHYDRKDWAKCCHQSSQACLTGTTVCGLARSSAFSLRRVGMLCDAPMRRVWVPLVWSELRLRLQSYVCRLRPSQGRLWHGC
jgi:hypothetical protein